MSQPITIAISSSTCNHNVFKTNADAPKKLYTVDTGAQQSCLMMSLVVQMVIVAWLLTILLFSGYCSVWLLFSVAYNHGYCSAWLLFSVVITMVIVQWLFVAVYNHGYCSGGYCYVVTTMVIVQCGYCSVRL
jgi:uncharacterized membrane protein YqhA